MRQRERAQNQRGAAMVLTAIYIFVLLLFCGLALDFGRAHLLRAQLQTALDAATLAGALHAVPWVEITVLRRYWFTVDDLCWDPEKKVWYKCGEHWEFRDASVCCIRGTEAALLVRQEWRKQVDCRWPYECLGVRRDREWIELPPDALVAARETFARNATWPQGTQGVMLRQLSITAELDRARVVGRAALAMPTSFLRMVRVGEIPVVREAKAEPLRR